MVPSYSRPMQAHTKCTDSANTINGSTSALVAHVGAHHPSLPPGQRRMVRPQPPSARSIPLAAAASVSSTAAATDWLARLRSHGSDVLGSGLAEQGEREQRGGGHVQRRLVTLPDPDVVHEPAAMPGELLVRVAAGRAGPHPVPRRVDVGEQRAVVGTVHHRADQHVGAAGQAAGQVGDLVLRALGERAAGPDDEGGAQALPPSSQSACCTASRLYAVEPVSWRYSRAVITRPEACESASKSLYGIPAWNGSALATALAPSSCRLRSADSCAVLTSRPDGLPAATMALARSACASALVSYRLNVSPPAAMYVRAQCAAWDSQPAARESPSARPASASSAPPSSRSSDQESSG